ncbi:MAG: hypothetical protein J0L99_16685 [Chitinophagales bacterium]|nr:hypothetical protein [Chitinophagales bacterium]
MFANPSNPFEGIAAGTSWAQAFTTALNTFKNQRPQDLEAALDSWDLLTHEIPATYQPAEIYCIKMSWLWQIYQAYQQHNTDPADRAVYFRAKKVVQETPAPGLPTDRAFLEDEGVIKKTITHLQAIAAFYQNALNTSNLAPAAAMESATAPAGSGNFVVTTILSADTDGVLALSTFNNFIKKLNSVRALIIGNADPAKVQIIDDCLNKPGLGIDQGKGLWIQSTQLLRNEAAAWIAANLPGQNYDNLLCVFGTPAGAANGLLSRTDAVNFAVVRTKVNDAALADL